MTVARMGYRALFRSQLDADTASDIRYALQLAMPLGSDRFAAAICARLGIRRNTTKRGRARKTNRPSDRRQLKNKDLDSENGGSNDAK